VRPWRNRSTAGSPNDPAGQDGVAENPDHNLYGAPKERPEDRLERQIDDLPGSD
jgi:hypothetical protein